MEKRPLVISWTHFLLLTTILLVPILSFNSLAYSVIEKSLFFCGMVEVIFGLWLYALVQNPSYRPPRNSLLLAAGTFLIVYTLSGLFAVSPEAAFWSNMTRMSGLILLFHVAAFVLVLVSTVRDERTWSRVFGVTAISGALVTLPTYLSALDPVSGTTLKSSFGNDSYVAAYLTFAFFFSLILLFRSKSRKHQVFFGACAAVMLFSPLFFNLSGLSHIFTDPIASIGTARAAAASIVAGLILSGLAYAATSAQARLAQAAKVALILYIKILVVLAVLMLVPGSAIQDRVDDLGLGSRLVFWESAIEGAKARPLLGYGPENYFVPFYQHFEPALLTGEYAYEVYTSKPHSAYLEILVSGGVLSLLPYLLLWVLAFTWLWRLWCRGDLARATTVLLAGLLTAYLLQNVVLFDTLSSYMGIGIVAAYLAHVAAGARAYPKIGRWSWPKAAAIAGLVSVALYFFTIMPGLQQARLIHALEEVTVSERAELYDDLFALSPSMRTSMGEYLMGKLLAVVPAMLDDMTDRQKELILEDVSSLRSEVERYAPTEPVHYRHTYYLARLYLLEWVLEAPENHESLLERVEELEIHLERLSPNNPQTHWIKAQREIFANEAQAALNTLRASDESVPNIQTTLDRINAVEAYLQGKSAAPFFTD